ncbi:MAG: hypothetical protein M1834_005369 [Cirrosporium novae-zelandiae]|nr:MAG: hypothetical protein M1834_005369 [Cirrosporium novae-zelandiae]
MRLSKSSGPQFDPQQQSRLPPAPPLAMSSTTANPASSTPLPQANTTTTTTALPHPITPAPPHHPHPKLLLHCPELTHPGAHIFFTCLPPTSSPPAALASAITHSLTHLYTPHPQPNIHVPQIRSISLYLRPLPHQVAYTTGTDLDPDFHKEIHLSLWYVATKHREFHKANCQFSGCPANCGNDNDDSAQGWDVCGDGKVRALVRHEILGVLTHEVVHTLQFNGKGSAPGGFIEGVADFVRLRAGLAPAHWGEPPVGPPKKENQMEDTATGTATTTATATTSALPPGMLPPHDEPPTTSKTTSEKWDAGYQHTAYFLNWLDQRAFGGDRVVHRMNQFLAQNRYEERGFWEGCCGRDVGVLWRRYLGEREGT